jgi:hypothetical protein
MEAEKVKEEMVTVTIPLDAGHPFRRPLDHLLDPETQDHRTEGANDDEPLLMACPHVVAFQDGDKWVVSNFDGDRWVLTNFDDGKMEGVALACEECRADLDKNFPEQQWVHWLATEDAVRQIAATPRFMLTIGKRLRQIADGLSRQCGK